MAESFYVRWPSTGGGGGSGTVTYVSVVTANGFSGTVANPTTTPHITLVGTLTGDITGTINANALTATTNSTLVTLSALSLPASQLTGTTLPSSIVASSLTSLGIQGQALNLGGFQINALGTPSLSTDAATKGYVDTIASGLQPIQAVAYASASTNYPGTMVGNVLTITATGAISVDGSNPGANSRILLKDQSTPSQNGIYVVTVAGTTDVSPVLTRASDYNTAADINAGDLIPVLGGTVNVDTSWLQTATIVTINSDSLVFVQWTNNRSAAYTVKGNNTASAATTADIQSLILGTPNYSDTGLLAEFTGSSNSYQQIIATNTNTGAAASADIIVSNNLSTATTYYGDFGINGSNFSGTGSLALPNATYLYSQTGDLVLGTNTANAMHFVIDNGATDAMTISTAGVVSAPTLSAQMGAWQLFGF